jgi:ABC-type nickel/cobalt efflux system permease component RcnA
VATVVGGGRNSVWRGIWIGASWGLGHTVPLVVVGVAILALKGQFMSTYEGFAIYFEFAVGLMLVALGAQVLWNLARRRLHLHEHLDGGEPHVHIHASHKHGPELASSTAHGDGGHSHGLWSSIRPSFRPRSFAIGMVHGLAGSAAVMLALLPEIESGLVGVGYLSLFGLGTVLSMAAITLALGAPLKLAANRAQVKVAIVGLAGVASLAIGAALMAEVASGTAVMPF